LFISKQQQQQPPYLAAHKNIAQNIQRALISTGKKGKSKYKKVSAHTWNNIEVPMNNNEKKLLVFARSRV